MPTEVMHDRYYSNIRSKLSFLVTEIRLDNSVNLQALNIHAENIFAGVLNILYGWSLKNANAVRQNATGIDLFDADNKVVVQVSSKHTHKKIQEESIDKIVTEKVGDGDSTPKYKGYHYYFLAIADIARPTKAFTIPNWLAFEPKTDILDLTRLLSDVLNSGIEKQKQLSELLDQEMSSETATRRMKTVAESKPISERNPFRYDAETVSFVGRDKEMEQLRSFLCGGATFVWWAIVGPGGTGKTRLAYEFRKELDEEGEWKTDILGDNAYQEIDSWTTDKINSLYPEKTLLFADEVQAHTTELWRLLLRLSADDFRREKPIRILLIGRDYYDVDGKLVWEKEICQYARKETLILDHKFSEITPLKKIDNAQPDNGLCEIIRSFAESMRIRESSNETLTVDEINEIYNVLCRIDPENTRPFYALIITDAYMQNKEATRWTKKQLLDKTAADELELLSGMVRSLSLNEGYNEKLDRTCRLLYCVFATFSPTAKVTIDGVKQLCQEEWETLSKATEKIGLPDVEAMLTRIGLIQENVAVSVKPDLLREYMVLSWFEHATSKERQRFYSICLNRFSDLGNTIISIIYDYSSLFSDDSSIINLLFPEKMAFDENRLPLFIRFLRFSFCDILYYPYRQRISEIMKPYVESVPCDSEKIIPALDDLSFVYKELAQYEAALDAVKKILEYSIRHYGEIAYQCAVIYHNASLIYYQMGVTEKAFQYCKKSIEILELNNREDLDLAAALLNLSELQKDCGSLGDAIQLAQRGLSIRKNLLPADDFAIANAHNILGEIYYEAGKYAEAETHLKESLRIRSESLEDGHPDLYYALGGLAAVYIAKGESEKATAICQEMLDRSKIVHGESHPETATAYNNAAVAFSGVGNYKLAITYSEKALSIREEILENTHPLVANSNANLGFLYHKIGDENRAIIHYKKAINSLEKKLGSQGPQLAIIYHNIAASYHNVGDLEKAEDYYHKALESHEKTYGASHPETAKTYHGLALLYMAGPKKNLKESLRLINMAKKAFITSFGPDNYYSKNELNAEVVVKEMIMQEE